MTANPNCESPIARHPRGSVLSVNVAPRASQSSIEELAGGLLRVRIAAPPVDGAANAALLRFLADVLGVPRSHLEIAAGKSSRRKRVVVDGMMPTELQQRLHHALEKGQ